MRRRGEVPSSCRRSEKSIIRSSSCHGNEESGSCSSSCRRQKSRALQVLGQADTRVLRSQVELTGLLEAGHKDGRLTGRIFPRVLGGKD